MKYKVIGWTYYDNSEILDSGDTIGFAERNAIIDEIRKHKYLFSGWHHQESWEGVVPVLNDGKKRCFSQRGWGGVMSEAYGYMNNYDYASFTFHQSIPSNKLKFAPDDFNIYEYDFEMIENEHFKVEVNEGLFEIAKTKNPFYLEDLDELRYIDKNDKITITCNNEELTFVVKDIDRDKTAMNLKNATKLISTKFKVIVTYKPESELEVYNVPKIITKSRAFNLFEEAIEDYDYDIILEAISLFDVSYLAKNLDKKKVKKVLTRFVREYTNSSYKPGNVIELLCYIGKYSLFEEIADKLFDNDKFIYLGFIKYFLEEKKAIDEPILKYSLVIDPNECNYDSIEILLKAINLRPDDKVLRKKYYKAIKNTRYEGLSIMAGGNLFKQLRKEDKKLIELDNYKKMTDDEVLKVIEYLTYPNENVNEKTYPFYLPKIYQNKTDVVMNGVKVYQEYINNNFDIDNMMEDILLYGIDQKCINMDRYYQGEEDASKYVWTLDMLTNYKYNLKGKALEKYAKMYQNFETEIIYIYEKNMK